MLPEKSTAADSEGSVYILRQVGKEHFIFLLLLVKKKKGE